MDCFGVAREEFRATRRMGSVREVGGFGECRHHLRGVRGVRVGHVGQVGTGEDLVGVLLVGEPDIAKPVVPLGDVGEPLVPGLMLDGVLRQCSR
jgi:hypothetical protein